MVHQSDAPSPRIRAAVAADAAGIAAVYNQSIADGGSTFETEPRTAAERAGWLAAHGDRWPVLVAEAEGTVVGWASVSPYSDRVCYGGIGEASVYVDRDYRRSGIGRRLLETLIAAASDSGCWKLIGRVIDGNAASLAMCRQCGFRVVGTHERHAKMGGRWTDVVVVERLIEANLD